MKSSGLANHLSALNIIMLLNLRKKKHTMFGIIILHQQFQNITVTLTKKSKLYFIYKNH